MAGHSKWHNIKFRKERQDAAKGKLFTKLARELIVAAREGGADPEMNIRLRSAIQAAKDASMPNDNIERAIKRGSGQLEGVEYVELTYEGYGPGGVAIFIRVLTDNPKRTVADIRNIMSKRGGSLGDPNCVAWMFEQKGLITVEKSKADEEQLMAIAVEAGADDLTEEDGAYEITCAPEAFQQVRDALTASGIEPETASVSMVPRTLQPLSGDLAEKVLTLMEELEDNDDVQRVYSNFDIPDEIMKARAA
jgi:YebC/PmpR family DNA-binding regulatory protein